jgi:hypothetical protein
MGWNTSENCCASDEPVKTAIWAVPLGIPEAVKAGDPL